MQLRQDLETELQQSLDRPSRPQRRRRQQAVTLESLNQAVKSLRRQVNQLNVALSNATAVLNTQLSAESTNRQVAIATLQDQLDVEETTRAQAVSNVRTQLSATISKLQRDLATVQDALDKEVATRANETASLSSQLQTQQVLVSTLEGRLNDLTYVPSDSVLTTDITLVPPSIQGPIIAPITGYTWRGQQFANVNDTLYERPIYKNVNRDNDDYWKYLVDELLLARVHAVMLGNRGCDDPNTGDEGPGNMCPRILRKFVAAVQMARAANVIRVGMWDDTGSFPSLANVDRLDLSNTANWDYFWSYRIKIFFETIPQGMWFLYQGKPVIAEWTLRDTFFSNQQGNASRLLTWLKQKFLDRFGVEPHFVLQKEWFTEDSTVTTAHALGRHSWFTPVSDVPTSIYSYTTYNGKKWGVTTPSFRDGATLIGCGTPCREVTRRNGTTLINALNAGRDATMILLEGWTDMIESAGFYRCSKWAYPHQYINLVRQYADPEPETLRFEAEAADAFFDTTVGNLGNQYALRNLDVGALPDNTGWYVGWTAVGEWLEFQNVYLGCGRYRFTARLATGATGRRLRLELRSSSGTKNLTSASLPNTNTGIANYTMVHLGEQRLTAGTYNLRIVFETAGNLNLDWIFVKRAAKCT